jgi:hypothetical protein
LEVSTNADSTLAPTARDKLNLRAARQNVNLCRAHNNGYRHGLPQPGAAHATQHDNGCACQLREQEPVRWVLAKL